MQATHTKIDYTNHTNHSGVNKHETTTLYLKSGKLTISRKHTRRALTSKPDHNYPPHMRQLPCATQTHNTVNANQQHIVPSNPGKTQTANTPTTLKDLLQRVNKLLKTHRNTKLLTHLQYATAHRNRIHRLPPAAYAYYKANEQPYTWLLRIKATNLVNHYTTRNTITSKLRNLCSNRRSQNLKPKLTEKKPITNNP
eukprot:gene3473-2424_t